MPGDVVSDALHQIAVAWFLWAWLAVPVLVMVAVLLRREPRDPMGDVRAILGDPDEECEPAGGLLVASHRPLPRQRVAGAQ